MMITIDFNTAKSSEYDLVLNGTIPRAISGIKPSNYIGGFLNKNEKTGSTGLKTSFALTRVEYKACTSVQLTSVEGMKKGKQVNDSMKGVTAAALNKIILS